MAAALVPGMASSSSARKARQESVVPIGIDAVCDASLLANDNTFYGDDEYDAGAAAAEWSDSDTEEDSSCTSVLCHRSDFGNIAISQIGDKEVSDVDEMMDIEQLDNSFLSSPDEDSKRPRCIRGA